MREHRTLLETLWQRDAIDLSRSDLFDSMPRPLPAHFDFSRVEGMLLGLTIGDALGAPTEGRTPQVRDKRHGEIRDYIQGRGYKAAVGIPTDDTQLAFWTLEQMLEDGGLVLPHLASRFCRDRVRGMGQTVRQFRKNWLSQTKPWYECGPKSAGNGALMRIAPVLVPHLRAPSTALWDDTTLCAMLTHNDAGSTAACLAFVAMLWELLQMEESPAPTWWLETYTSIARPLECDESYQPRAPHIGTYKGTLWRFVAQQVEAAYAQGRTVREACDHWYSGAYLLETLPSVFYILMCHADDPEEAIVRAVNDTKDNDTIAAIVGAAVGALHGKDALPTRWIDGHTGRTRKDDDGHIFTLLTQIRQRWNPTD